MVAAGTSVNPSNAATSGVPAGTVAVSLTLYVLLYAALVFFFLFYARRILGRGPDLDEQPPDRNPSRPYQATMAPQAPGDR
jgi:cytochrome bd-type quinol oxidase subunit 1